VHSDVMQSFISPTNAHSALCSDAHTKQDWINMRPHDRTV